MKIGGFPILYSLPFIIQYSSFIQADIRRCFPKLAYADAEAVDLAVCVSTDKAELRGSSEVGEDCFSQYILGHIYLISTKK